MRAGSKTLVRMAACGQTSAHLLHWMQMLRVPDGDVERDAALLPLRGAGRPGAVDREARSRAGVALPRQHHARSRAARSRAPPAARAAGACARRSAAAGTSTSAEAAQGRVDGGEVALHHLGPALAVRLLDRRLDAPSGLVRRQHLAEREEARLHDRGEVPAEPRLLGDRVRVDDVERAGCLSMICSCTSRGERSPRRPPARAAC